MDRSQYVRSMFSRIATRYDLLNRMMTLGQDSRWRRATIQKLNIQSSNTVLDIGAGTGDLAFEIIQQYPCANVVASDFTAKMVAVGRERQLGKKAIWVIADAQHLPFANGSFSRVVSGFLMRNVPNVIKSLQEQKRVLTESGQMACLDTTPLRPGPLRPFLNFHLHTIIPLLGRLVAGDAEAYKYLPDSTAEFLSAEELAEKIRAVGFKAVGFARRMFGTIAIHWGQVQE